MATEPEMRLLLVAKSVDATHLGATNQSKSGSFTKYLYDWLKMNFKQ